MTDTDGPSISDHVDSDDLMERASEQHPDLFDEDGDYNP